MDRMALSGLGSAPTMTWVLWPAGANFGARFSALDSSMRRRMRPMERRMVAWDFSGARLSSACSVGSSMLMLRRSA